MSIVLQKFQYECQHSIFLHLIIFQRSWSLFQLRYSTIELFLPETAVGQWGQVHISQSFALSLSDVHFTLSALTLSREHFFTMNTLSPFDYQSHCKSSLPPASRRHDFSRHDRVSRHYSYLDTSCSRYCFCFPDARSRIQVPIASYLA